MATKKKTTTPKLTLSTKRFSDSRNCRVRITDDAADIVNDLWLRTGMSATEIVSRIIIFASDYIEIKKDCFD